MSFLGLEIPIMQAPVGGSSGPELCAAVSGAGALGGMALTWHSAAQAQADIGAVRAATSAPFFGNFVLSFRPDALEPALDAGLPIVSFSWGDPAQWLPAVRRAGAKFGIQVGDLEGAKMALGHGSDLVICQGIEAGGHVQSTQSLLPLLESVVAIAGQTPVLAAGGIATGEHIARVLRAGASGAVLGTRFLVTRESRAHEEYKQAIVRARGSDTAMTLCFEGGWPSAQHRVLRNATLEMWEAAGCPPPGRRPGETDVLGKRDSGEEIQRYSMSQPRNHVDGRVLEMCLYCGMGAGEIHDIPGAAELVHRLWNEVVAAAADRERRQMTPEERAAAWRARSGHFPNGPLLSDEAISREAIYGGGG